MDPGYPPEVKEEPPDEDHAAAHEPMGPSQPSHPVHIKQEPMADAPPPQNEQQHGYEAQQIHQQQQQQQQQPREMQRGPPARYPVHHQGPPPPRPPPGPSFRERIAHGPHVRYFLIKSNSGENLSTSMELGVWATMQRNEEKLIQAFRSSSDVVLIFSLNDSGAFQGYARMRNEPGQSSIRDVFVKPNGQTFRARHFDIEWIETHDVPFQLTGHITNPLNDNRPVKIGRDGQELSPDCARALLALFDQHGNLGPPPPPPLPSPIPPPHGHFHDDRPPPMPHPHPHDYWGYDGPPPPMAMSRPPGPYRPPPGPQQPPVPFSYQDGPPASAEGPAPEGGGGGDEGKSGKKRKRDLKRGDYCWIIANMSYEEYLDAYHRWVAFQQQQQQQRTAGGPQMA